MKKIIISVLLFLICTGCSSNNDPIKDAEKWCDCVSKAEALSMFEVSSAYSLCEEFGYKIVMKYINEPNNLLKYKQKILECIFKEDTEPLKIH